MADKLPSLHMSFAVDGPDFVARIMPPPWRAESPLEMARIKLCLIDDEALRLAFIDVVRRGMNAMLKSGLEEQGIETTVESVLLDLNKAKKN